jgi:lipoprotein-anchoring transpeptidase ErfK/SrfK
VSSHAHRRSPLALIAVLCSVLGALVVGAGTAGAATPAPTSVARPIADAPAAGSVAAAAPAAPALTAGTPCAATAEACVDLSSRQAWLTDGAGHVTYGPVGALGGTRKYPTPTGTFSVDYKDADHVSNLYDAAMPNSVFFAPAVAFHRGSLSQRSHGCIHLGRSAAQRFFNELSSGDTVQVVP